LFKNTYGTKLYNNLLHQRYISNLSKMVNMMQKVIFPKENKALRPISTVILIIALIWLITKIANILTTAQNRAVHAMQIKNVSFQQSTTTTYV
jgi:preprotein translocase subunit SecE